MGRTSDLFLGTSATMESICSSTEGCRSGKGGASLPNKLGKCLSSCFSCCSPSTRNFFCLLFTVITLRFGSSGALVMMSSLCLRADSGSMIHFYSLSTKPSRRSELTSSIVILKSIMWIVRWAKVRYQNMISRCLKEISLMRYLNAASPAQWSMALFSNFFDPVLTPKLSKKLNSAS